MEMFKPELALLWEREDAYTLAAVTMTPHNGFSVGAAQIGTPAGMVHVPEAVPLTLTISHRTGMYFPIATPVTHSFGGLEVGGKSGKTSVVAYTLLGDSIVGFNSIGAHEIAARLPVGESEWSPVLGFKDWHAVAGRKASKRRVYVRGAITFRAFGYTAKLVEQDTGMDPHSFMCSLEVEPPPEGAAVPMLHDVYVTFEGEGFSEAQEKVTIMQGGNPILQIPIQEIG